MGRAEEAGEREGGRGGEWVWAPLGRAGEAAEVRRLQVRERERGRERGRKRDRERERDSLTLLYVCHTLNFTLLYVCYTLNFTLLYVCCTSLVQLPSMHTTCLGGSTVVVNREKNRIMF